MNPASKLFQVARGTYPRDMQHSPATLVNFPAAQNELDMTASELLADLRYTLAGDAINRLMHSRRELRKAATLDIEFVRYAALIQSPADGFAKRRRQATLAPRYRMQGFGEAVDLVSSGASLLSQ